jgi:hypothetical protein
MKHLLFLAISFAGSSCSFQKMYQINAARSQQPYEQINFVDLVKKYVSKDKPGSRNIEGIYSVSITVFKRNKGLFSSEERERMIEQKEHYAQVAIIRDNARNNREYIEVPVDKNYLASYSVRGELTTLSEGNILVLKHFEPRGKPLTYSFTYDKDRDILEGIRTETNGNVTYTYKLNFVKLYPKETSD